MSDDDKTINRTAGLMKALGISGEQLQNAKLGPGVVGRNSVIAHTFLVVALAGVIASAYLHNNLLLGLSLCFGFMVALAIPILNAYFGNKNPAAALLEGAQFLQYHQFQMASQGKPEIEAKAPPELPPQTTGSNPKLSQGDDSE
jgi:hypothetical protein